MINLNIIHKKKLLSLAIFNKKKIFHKEIIGSYVNSYYIISLINEILIKNKLNFKNISHINFCYNKKKLTSLKILITVIQIISITKSIPIIINNKLKKNIIKNLFKTSIKNHKKYLIPNSSFIKY